MGPLELLLAPPRLTRRALDDLHALAVNAERVAGGDESLGADAS